jgi:perosamine synthetase
MKKFFPISQPSITQKEIDLVTDAVSSTWVSSLGKYIDRFEEEFAAYCGSKYAVTTSNGTVAIHLALVALGIGKGDEVIIPDLTFIATANAVLYAGAKPVVCDIDPYNLCMDPKQLEQLITPRTKAIMPVHLYGHPADMRRINQIAEKHGLLVIEDAAEAHGSSIEGKKVGSWGHCATFSFYGNKNITTGEGGMITTDDEELYHKLRLLRDHAMSKEKRYWHETLGFNYRMTNLQAALGCAQMERVEELTAKRKWIFDMYQKYLGEETWLRLNRTCEWADNTYWIMCAEIDELTEETRDLLMKELKTRGVDSRPYFYPVSDMPYLTLEANTPITHKVFKIGINLPTYFDLSENDIASISSILKEVYETIYKVESSHQ